MNQKEIEQLKAALRDDWFASYKLDAKAKRYVSQFFDRS